jgi:pimeloyl-ACP methyl ester carboxylesterase
VKHIFSKARPLIMWPDAFRFFPPLRILLPGPDARAIEDPDHFAGVFGCQRDAFTDVEGLYADAALYAERWGFGLEDIEFPVHFWHGRDDANFHWSLAEEMAGRVRGARMRIVENEGHFSLPINQADAILAAMAQAC